MMEPIFNEFAWGLQDFQQNSAVPASLNNHNFGAQVFNEPFPSTVITGTGTGIPDMNAFPMDTNDLVRSVTYTAYRHYF
jgi:hypothetical protein